MCAFNFLLIFFKEREFACLLRNPRKQVQIRELHGDGDNGIPAVGAGMEKEFTGFPRGWKQVLRGPAGMEKLFAGNPRKTLDERKSQLSQSNVDNILFLHGQK